MDFRSSACGGATWSCEEHHYDDEIDKKTLPYFYDVYSKKYGIELCHAKRSIEHWAPFALPEYQLNSQNVSEKETFNPSPEEVQFQQQQCVDFVRKFFRATKKTDPKKCDYQKVEDVTPTLTCFFCQGLMKVTDNVSFHTIQHIPFKRSMICHEECQTAATRRESQDGDFMSNLSHCQVLQQEIQECDFTSTLSQCQVLQKESQNGELLFTNNNIEEDEENIDGEEDIDDEEWEYIIAQMEDDKYEEEDDNYEKEDDNYEEEDDDYKEEADENDNINEDSTPEIDNIEILDVTNLLKRTKSPSPLRSGQRPITNHCASPSTVEQGHSTEPQVVEQHEELVQCVQVPVHTSVQSKNQMKFTKMSQKQLKRKSKNKKRKRLNKKKTITITGCRKTFKTVKKSKGRQRKRTPVKETLSDDNSPQAWPSSKVMLCRRNWQMRGRIRPCHSPFDGFSLKDWQVKGPP